MTINDMRWLWIYYDAKVEVQANLEKFLEGTRGVFEGSGTAFPELVRDVGYVFPTAEEAFQTARRLMLSELPLKQVCLKSYAAKADSDYHLLQVDMEFSKKTATHIVQTAQGFKLGAVV